MYLAYFGNSALILFTTVLGKLVKGSLLIFVQRHLVLEEKSSC